MSLPRRHCSRVSSVWVANLFRNFTSERSSASDKVSDSKQRSCDCGSDWKPWTSDQKLEIALRSVTMAQHMARRFILI